MIPYASLGKICQSCCHSVMEYLDCLNDNSEEKNLTSNFLQFPVISRRNVECDIFIEKSLKQNDFN